MQRPKACAATPPNSARASGCGTTGEGGAGSTVRRAEPRQRQRMGGIRSSGRMMSSARGSNRRRSREPPAPPRAVGAEPLGRFVDRPVEHAGAAPVERVDAVDLGPAATTARTGRGRALEQEGSDGHGVDRRAVVVQQARQDRFAAACAATDLVVGLDHGDLSPASARTTAAASPLGPARRPWRCSCQGAVSAVAARAPAVDGCRRVAVPPAT